MEIDLINSSTQTLSDVSAAPFSWSSFVLACTPLIFYVVGIAVYAMFIFKFYQWMARRDVLGLELHKRSELDGFFSKIARGLLYALEHLVLTPLLVFLWSAILAVFFVVLAKSHTPEQILLTSVALVAVVRILSYYNEDLAKELAKLIPLTLLAVFMFDTGYFSIDRSMDILLELPSMWKIAVYYVLFSVAIEFVMRLVYAIARRKSKEE